MNAWKLLLDAYLHDKVARAGTEQRLTRLAIRMRLFVPPQVIREGEVAIRATGIDPDRASELRWRCE